MSKGKIVRNSSRYISLSTFLRSSTATGPSVTRGPSIMPRKRRIMYQAAGTTTAVPSIPKMVLLRKAPSRARNSPAKLFRPGRPSDDSTAMNMTVASTGTRRASPPKSLRPVKVK